MRDGSRPRGSLWSGTTSSLKSHSDVCRLVCGDASCKASWWVREALHSTRPAGSPGGCLATLSLGAAEAAGLSLGDVDAMSSPAMRAVPVHVHQGHGLASACRNPLAFTAATASLWHLIHLPLDWFCCRISCLATLMTKQLTLQNQGAT